MAVTHGAGTRNAIADTVVDRLDVGGTGTLVLRTSGDVEVATLTFSATAYGAASGGTATANAITSDASATGGTVAKAAQVGVTHGDVILCSVTATGGGADIVYKRQHKKLHDEIEEYFSRLTEEEAEEVVVEARVMLANDEARQAVADSLHARAVAEVVKLIEEERNAELRALLALAQDEDDAEAVLTMLEALH